MITGVDVDADALYDLCCSRRFWRLLAGSGGDEAASRRGVGRH